LIREENVLSANLVNGALKIFYIADTIIVRE